MPFLIDGYNLLHASGVFGRGPGTLENARLALLNFLTIHLESYDLKYTTIVFDAKDAPPGLPDTYDFQGMTVRFARGYIDADALLEELIAAHTTPRRLTVVSSDHRVQRAGRRRRSTVVDSDVWCNQLISEKHDRRRGNDEVAADLDLRRTKTPRAGDGKPKQNGDWQKEFADIDVDAIAAELGGGFAKTPRQDDRPGGKESKRAESAAEGDKDCGELDNPFPQDYLDDLADEL